MTRDEAIKRFDEMMRVSTQTHWINIFVELGMPKLDESTTAQKKAEEAFKANRATAPHYMHEIFEILEKCGLRIVEK